MSVKPFRFFRGELNGFYILNALLSRNDSIGAILSELVYQGSVAFTLQADVVAGQSPIRKEDLLGLGQFAGILRPIQYLINTLGSLLFSESKIVDGQQYSERALFNMMTQEFEYIRTDPSVYTTDITTQATANLRSSFVPHGAVPVGYCVIGTVLFDADGTYHPENLLSSPPIDGSHYEEYYGPNYLTLENDLENDGAMSVEMFMQFYECIQKLRQSGPSISMLLELTELFGQGYMTNIEIVSTGYYYTLYYDLDSGAGINPSALNAWLSIIARRFKNIVVQERTH